MPHIHLETTADLPENADIPDILEALVAALATMETVSPASLKAYHTLRSTWVMGEGAPAGFAHCTLMILTGRSPELQRRMAEEAMSILKRFFAASLEANEVALSLELREMQAATYLRA